MCLKTHWVYCDCDGNFRACQLSIRVCMIAIVEDVGPVLGNDKFGHEAYRHIPISRKINIIGCDYLPL